MLLVRPPIEPTVTRFVRGSDRPGNTATGTFSVTVVDTTAPVLTLPADMTVEATGAGGATVTYTASALDAVDGPITPSCSPVSGTVFALGTTVVSCTATDAAGNTASGTFSVTVVDTTAPPSPTPSPAPPGTSNPSPTSPPVGSELPDTAVPLSGRTSHAAIWLLLLVVALTCWRLSESR